jgi:hypothetical protein
MRAVILHDMKLQWLGVGLCLAMLAGCEAKIDSDTGFAARSGGDMMSDDESNGRAGSSADGDESGAGRGTGGDSSDPSNEMTAGRSGSVAIAGTGAAGMGSVEPPSIEPAPGVNIGGPYDLGVLPSGFTITWPAEPLITQEVEVSTVEQFEEAASIAGTRVVLKASISAVGSYVYTDASDLEIVMDDGVSVNATIMIPAGNRRIRLLGGRYQGVLMAPTQSVGQPLAEDVMFDGLTIDASAPTSSAFLLRGRRVAVIRSSASAGHYCVFTGVIDGVQNSDIIIAGNTFQSQGAESTVRIVSAINSVTVDNRLTNGMKHNYRIHGLSSRSYAARNVLINAGTMFGNFAEDVLDEVWFNDNTFYHNLPDLFHPDRNTVAMLHARGNVAYTDVWDCFLCSTVPANWDLTDNQMMPYRPAP